MATEQCRNCRFSKTGGHAGYLMCRRYPPTMTGDRRIEATRFPDVEADGWCGEWLSMRPGSGLPTEIKPPKGPSDGPAAGGRARAVALTPERRAEIASNAARSRWSRS